MSRVARGVAIALACLMLVQPMLPPGLAHTGGDEEHHAADGSTSDGSRSDAGGDSGEDGGHTLNPRAERATPHDSYVEQGSPAVHGPLIVFEHRALGRDWDIMALNTSSGGGPFPLTTRAVDERNPDVRGPWIAWEADHQGANATRDVVVFDIRTGHAIRVPDSGFDDRAPVIGARTVYYLAERPSGPVLRAFDLDTRTVEAPLGNRTIVGEPAAHGHQLAWATGSKSEAKIHVKDTRTGNVTDVPRLWRVEDGLTMGRHGLAFIARVGGAQSGTYTWRWTEDAGLTSYRGSVYPQDNVDACGQGFVYDQPGTSTGDAHAIVVQDAYADAGLTLTKHNFDPACSAERVAYVKEVEHPDEDVGTVRWVYHFDAENIRRQVESTILLADGLEQDIYSGTARFHGTILPGDPREPIQKVFVSVDDNRPRPIDFSREDGVVRWAAEVDTRPIPNGAHRLEVRTVDTMGSVTQKSFVFYVDQPFQMSREDVPTGVDVPRTESSPFPFSILDHYQKFQPFYNTVLLVVLLVAAAIWAVVRFWDRGPRGTPEYVPPDER